LGVVRLKAPFANKFRLIRLKYFLIALSVLTALIVIGLALFQFIPERWNAGGRLAAAVALLFGLFGIFIGVVLSIMALRIAKTRHLGDLLSSAYEKRVLNKGPKIVVIGGGTGLATLLRGLKKYTSHLTAVVAVTDDGGSSGRLRNEFGILPPGDIRNCLTALADREPLMEQLFQYRFGKGSGLAGHNFGNLFITAMTDITGDFELAIKQSSRVLAIRGQVLPSTLDKVVLAAELEDDSIIGGESLIGKANRRIKRVYLVPANPSPPQEVVEAIGSADAIIMGPGSLFTSVLPNLLVPDVLKAVRNSNALRIYVMNIMTQAGETRHFTASDHVKTIHNHCGPGLIDTVIVNTEEIAGAIRERYLGEGSVPVFLDREALAKEEVKIITGNYLSKSNFARHDSEVLAEMLMNLIDVDRIKNKRGPLRCGLLRCGPLRKLLKRRD
jgi:uncharacterized cofD-like protein